jgi:hypothetical protein
MITGADMQMFRGMKLRGEARPVWGCAGYTEAAELLYHTLQIDGLE